MTTIKSIDPITACEWLDNNEAILIDVREPAEYKEVHIDGAHLIPVNTASIGKLPSDIKNKKIIVHCMLEKRGSIACEKLLSENLSLDIYNLTGGIVAWENAGLKCNKKGT
ncbi:MAG: rhodanese protein [uncultured bacterium]|nr:MAG: rhodanese protein [uncultured bacterium]OGT25948.1 MAG: hypothetical protein A3B71_07865 [Gammaproteobacteria bacterium RIFCSPHIGHO2_02_FULL_42_43]OGT52333.1 MAG: hypothetical protein A3E54_01745 [Gammaproteobacteria bacterium RIFCSPHIGHO2_12_FULL_41_25]OGT61944.1 MAG: hypothetical protein A3I77_01680 [Gammaproteobacteria bacterium RIFCSPLOWO2_02_FULL_42_14]OGT86344.1 MAG: hypothetical protein A3G86_07410 [Gammaproteobacteria bacterium RIFCSPLOWO2_12_FULL_42_18]